MRRISQYKGYTNEQLEELFSNYLIGSWSYSGVSTFSRNEKEFERLYIYKEAGRKSASAVAGSAYHKALEFFFQNLQEGKEMSLLDMQTAAYIVINETPANEWKLQKTNPTVEQCIQTATANVNVLLDSFYKEKDLYLDEIAEVLGVEERIEDFLTVNGVDIPLPAHMVLDLIVKTKDGKTVIIDHKSKTAYSDEKSLALTRGSQAITYVLGYETYHGVDIDEVWFIENKIGKNRDGSPQMKNYKIQMDEDTRALYESLLYEPLRRMLSAAGDPEYVYTINNADTMCDVSELYDFWTRTIISEVDDFKDIPDDKKDMIAKRMKKIKESSRKMISPKAIITFRKKAASFITYDYNATDMTNAEKITHVLQSFNIPVSVDHVIEGYSCDTFLISMSAGVEYSKVGRKHLEIANALNVADVRVSNSLVPYEGKSYLAIEVNKKREKDLLWDGSYCKDEKIALGLDNYGQPVYWDLANNSTPHLLCCGGSGSGKSISIKTIIEGAKAVGVEDIIVMDNKYEMSDLAGVTVYQDIYDIEKAMEALVAEMDYRIANGVSKKTLIVIDEYADCRDQMRTGKRLEEGEASLEVNLKRILQKGRSSGFRVVVATQRASVKVIPGDLKANLAVRVCFRLPDSKSSMVVLDETGAEQLGGSGDGIFMSPECLNIPTRFQGFYRA